MATNKVSILKKIIIFIVIINSLIDIQKKNIYKIKYCKHISNKKLIDMPKNRINPLILKEKKELFEYISLNIGKNITSVKTLFLNNNLKFGNQFILLNKAIFYCELLGCKRIILNEKFFWYIKSKIFH